jgi:polyisoprenoid-binding protein YceI
MPRVVLFFLPLFAACGDPVLTGEPTSTRDDAAAGQLPGQLELPPENNAGSDGDGGAGDGGAGDGGAGDGGAVDDPSQAPVVATSAASDSLLYALVWRDPSAVGNSFAHDHVLRASDWAGTFTFARNDATACAVDVDVVTGALLNDEPSMRDAVGFDSEMSERDTQSVRDTMLGAGQLDAGTHPTLSFTSTACRGDLDGAGELLVDGTLTLHGIDQPVTWVVEYGIDDSNSIVARGSLTVAQSDFGITPYEAFFGAVKVADDVDLVFELTASPR